MIQTIEAIIDDQGNITLLEPVRLEGSRRALVTILDDRPVERSSDAGASIESALAEDWNREEEDQAWLHLQQAP